MFLYCLAGFFLEHKSNMQIFVFGGRHFFGTFSSDYRKFFSHIMINIVELQCISFLKIIQLFVSESFYHVYVGSVVDNFPYFIVSFVEWLVRRR